MPIPRWAFEYESVGFETIPLIAGGKQPIPGISWKFGRSEELWSTATPDSNIGLRCGKLSVIDCDNKKTPDVYKKVLNHLEVLGLIPGDFPVVQTASGIGRHIYLGLRDAPRGSVALLSRQTGSGELRFGPNCYVVAPPSIIGGVEYRFLFGDIHHIPEITWDKVTPLIGSVEVQLRRNISRKAWGILKGDNYVLARYATRSEAEQALISSLIRSGYSFIEIKALFNKYPCAGKYSQLKNEKSHYAERYLHGSFDNAQEWLATHESSDRKLARSVAQWTGNQSWPGQTGAVDQSVLVAHCQIMGRACTQPYAASSRDLSLIAGISPETASRATCRLCRAGLLTLVTPGKGMLASQYKLGHNLTLYPPLRDEVSDYVSIESHDVFRRGGLGKSGAQIYKELIRQPMTIKEISGQTGRSIKTVKRCLSKMSRLVDLSTGESLAMAHNEDGKWHPEFPDLDHVARLLGTAGEGRRHRDKYQKERELHRKSIQILKFGQTRILH